jgi:YgiT-type zinc finger domain-containing protein
MRPDHRAAVALTTVDSARAGACAACDGHLDSLRVREQFLVGEVVVVVDVSAEVCAACGVAHYDADVEAAIDEALRIEAAFTEIARGLHPELIPTERCVRLP